MTATLKFNKQNMVIPRGLNTSSLYTDIYGKKEDHFLLHLFFKYKVKACVFF